MPPIIYSADSQADLREIWDYIAENSQLQADRLVLRFRSKLDYLAKWKTIGRPRPEIATGCRSYPYGNYCFYFRPTEAGIEVIRILHSARDIGQIDFPD